MKRIIALLLCLVTVLGLMTACDDREKDSKPKESSKETGIVGTWQVEVKQNPIVLSLRETSTNWEDYLDYDQLSIRMTLKLSKDGTYTQTYNSKDIDRIADILPAAIYEALKDIAKEIDMPYKDMLEMAGYPSNQEVFQETLRTGLKEKMKEPITGKYTWEDEGWIGGVLTLYRAYDQTDGGQNMSQKVYNAELEGDTLIIKTDEETLVFKRK